jgi:predicted metalloprotease
MEWRGRRESSNIEDRRGGGGMIRPAGFGGIGLVVVVLIGMFFGVDLTPLLGTGGGPVVTSEAPSGPNTIDDEQEQFVAVILAQTEDVWTPLFQAAGMQYTQPKLVLFTGQTRSACGFAQSAMGPFYCPNDQTVYLDMDFFRVMERQLGSRGEFAKAYVIAHEVGHHVQDEQGILSQVNSLRERSSERQSNALSVRIELQADCYSGVWANHTKDEKILEPGDVEQGLNAAAAVGDDRIQKEMTGHVNVDRFTHGSSQQRMSWFKRGFESGDPAACNTFGSR